MATLNFIYRSKKDTGNLLLRLKQGAIHLRYTSKILSRREYWFTTDGKHKALENIAKNKPDEYKVHKKYLEGVRETILQRFETDLLNNVLISKEWFKNVVDEVVNIDTDKNSIEKKAQEQKELLKQEREKQKELYNISLVQTAIENVINTEYNHKPTEQKKYRQTLNKIKEYQKDKHKKIKIDEVNQDFIYKFENYLRDELEHAHSVVVKHGKQLIHAVKYQKDAHPDVVNLFYGIDRLKHLKQSKADAKQERDQIVVTLTFDELNQIHNTEVPPQLYDAKKTILFGCEVGLRVSDYNKLIDENITTLKNGLQCWEFYNKKTASDVTIPINDRIQEYIRIYGKPKTDFKENDEIKLNREIKEVCRIAGINKEVQGKKDTVTIIKGKPTKRKIAGTYKKHQIITCHTFRRSFATNYYRVLGLNDTRRITGHKNNEMLLNYINESLGSEKITIEMIEKMNEKNRELKEINKPQLKVI